MALGGYFAFLRNVSGKFARLYDSVPFLQFYDMLVTIFAIYPEVIYLVPADSFVEKVPLN
jgi:hypothetical protein